MFIIYFRIDFLKSLYDKDLIQYIIQWNMYMCNQLKL